MKRAFLIGFACGAIVVAAAIDRALGGHGVVVSVRRDDAGYGWRNPADRR